MGVGGDYSGWLATIGGMAGGADYIITPEIELDTEDMLKNIRRRYEVGKKFSIVVVEEKVDLPEKLKNVVKECDMDIKNPADMVAKYISENTENIDVRTVELGYLQRGGSPSAFDRFLAFKFGFAAIDSVKKGKMNIALGLRGFDVEDSPLTDKIKENKEIRPDIYEMARLFF
jgi:6-phosphofructokinase 1